jgi:transposase
MGFIGGNLQERFVERIRGVDPTRLLAVPIDVGKASAAALVCDFWGEVVSPPFTFPLTAPGVEAFTLAVARAEAERDAAWVRAGLEQAGHYHRTLLARLEQAGLEVALLNPAQVKENRNQSLLRSLKSDATDLGAMAELLIRGKGRPTWATDDAMAVQAALVAHRARKVKARSAVKNHLHASLDLVFPGLSGCLSDVLETKLGRLLLVEGMDPQRIQRLGPERLRGFCARRGVMVQRRKAVQIVEAARGALSLSPQVRKVHAGVLAADVALLGTLDRAIALAEDGLAEVLSRTPVGILTTLPRVGVVRASSYGAALGDPARVRTAAQVYRMAGLVPSLYESAGRRRWHTSISREGKAELRKAIIELGRALRQGDHDFARYADQLAARGKVRGVIACALGHRANRVAFAMVRDQVPYEPAGGSHGDEGGRVMAEQARPDQRRPPTQSLPPNDQEETWGGAGPGATSTPLWSQPTWTPDLA